MHSHMMKYNQKGVEGALESLKTGYDRLDRLFKVAQRPQIEDYV